MIHFPARINRFDRIIPILSSPWSLLVSIALGMVIGRYLPEVAETIAPFGKLYLALLTMCVLPILISGITLSISRLLGENRAGRYIRRVIIVFVATFLSVSAIAIIIGLISHPGADLDSSSLDKLGVAVNQSNAFDLEIPVRGAPPEAKEMGIRLTDFFFELVPNNIFESLSRGNTLQVVFFTIVFGISLGTLARQTESVQRVFELLESIYETFKKLIAWSIVFLPLALFCLIAEQTARVGVEVLLAMAKFAVTATIGFAVVYILGCLLIWQRSGKSLFKVLSIVREPTILALATSSALASMPTAISTMSESLNFDRRNSDSILPLAITVGRFGQVTYFALASIFVVELYNEPLGLSVLGTIIFGSILAGIASSGTTGVVTLTTLNLVLDPLNLPLEAVLLLFIAIDPLMDPLRTLCTLHTGMAVTAAIAEPPQNREQPATNPTLALVSSPKLQEN